MTTTTIKTTGRTLAATCFGMPAAILPVPGFAGSGFAGTGFAGTGFGGSGLGTDGLFTEVLLVDAIVGKRPMSASVAAEAAVNHGFGYAAGVGNHLAAAPQYRAEQQSEQMHTMWAYRGPGPWKERT